MENREAFQEGLANCLESIFEDLKNSSKVLAEKCVLPTASMEIKIKPVGDIGMSEIPGIEVTYDFLPSKEAIEKLFETGQ